ncbi:hypothetical protein PARPLA_00472 [Rhodobacteraceae bacterium THAF1]|uniref:hypothetical protein n=1 Tax=Palleronia sp. THAF1 TaxID=2587842 RepID=UPI000F3C150A|nr:hypothetical protein [Palleronia sp. THAF1]QFU09965.1 hypothetical protein FIU81_14900 [Palleronia sp. THAF1]VDC17130.1 hypothetical protein PARPLA_00472 [Rhodobacteraceae bacterium THAF1]
MKGLFLVLSLTLFAGPAAAACFVDYKASRDDPLQLHYGVVELTDAECEDPEAAVAGRIAVDDWTLLSVMSVMTEDEALEIEADAGAYFLRY